MVRFVGASGNLNISRASLRNGVAPACVFKPYTIIDIKEETEEG